MAGINHISNLLQLSLVFFKYLITRVSRVAGRILEGKHWTKKVPRSYPQTTGELHYSQVRESIIISKILKYLESRKLTHDRLYGFLHERSTANLLTSVTHTWSLSLEFQGESQAIVLENSKAFDRFWHSGLFQKILYGMPSKLCAWICRFLSKQTNIISREWKFYSINVGVPHGSILAPILFLLNTNDLLSITSNLI